MLYHHKTQRTNFTMLVLARHHSWFCEISPQKIALFLCVATLFWFSIYLVYFFLYIFWSPSLTVGARYPGKIPGEIYKFTRITKKQTYRHLFFRTTFSSVLHVRTFSGKNPPYLHCNKFCNKSAIPSL